jgi:hypothetical protein
MNKIDPADPNRCQYVTSKGQCIHLAVERSRYCEVHEFSGKEKIRKERLRHYLLANPDLAARYNRHSAIEEVKNLRDEIALARAMIGKRLDAVENNSDFLAACGTVNSYLKTVEKLVSSCHKMEISLNTLLSKASIFTLGQEIVSILVDELSQIDNYEEIVDKISERIIATIAHQKNEE